MEPAHRLGRGPSFPVSFISLRTARCCSALLQFLHWPLQTASQNHSTLWMFFHRPFEKVIFLSLSPHFNFSWGPFLCLFGTTQVVLYILLYYLYHNMSTYVNNCLNITIGISLFSCFVKNSSIGAWALILSIISPWANLLYHYVNIRKWNIKINVS